MVRSAKSDSMLRAAAAVLALCAVGGCGDDGTVGPETPAPDTGSHNGVDADRPAPPELCSLAQPAPPFELPCSTSADCDTLQVCVSNPDGGASCLQLCFAYDCSPDSCGAGFECADLQDTSGQTFNADLNGDGQSEFIGACIPTEPADPPLSEDWGPCGGNLPCPETSLCVGIGTSGQGTCLPQCTDYCAPFSGFFTECLGTTSGVGICAITCDPSDGTFACPPALRCSLAAAGLALCGQ